MSALARILGILSLAVFLASLAAHVAAYIPGSGVSLRNTDALHLGMMGAVIFTAIHSRIAQWQSGSGREAFEERASRITPRWAYVGIFILIMYAFLIGIVDFFAYEGQPHIHDRKFALTSHGRLIREVSEAVFHAAERSQVRSWSAGWMVCSALSAFYCLYLYPRLRARLAADAGG